MPEIASVKSVLAIETVSEPEYGLIESRPPVGRAGVGRDGEGVAGVEETPALLTALTDCAPLPLLEPSKRDVDLVARLDGGSGSRRAP